MSGAVPAAEGVLPAAAVESDGAGIGWGLVGCGWVGRTWVLPALAGAGTVVALCDLDCDALARAAAGHPRARATGDLAAFLATPGLDAVYVATPNHVHAPVVVAAARAGRHVLCEKPMASTLDDARRMVTACRDAGVLYATAFDQRFHARHRQLRRLVAEGALGTVTLVRIHYACWLGPDWTPWTDRACDNWRVDPQRAGGGALVDLAPHGVDLVQVLLDDELEALTGLTQRQVHGYAVDDGAVLVGRTARGTLVTIAVAYNCPDVLPRRRLELVGTEAMAVATDTMGQTAGGRVTLVDAHTGAATELPAPAGDDVSPFAHQVAAFAACVAGGRPFPHPPERDLRAFEQVLSACP